MGELRIDVGTIVIAMVGGWTFGINPLTNRGPLSGGGGVEQVQQQALAKRPPAEDWMAKYV